MRLNRLTIQGYKSFAARTEFLFPTGITAIVGPNGSGKSNIADAIRWVLGEQSMRTLRGKSTADMIFAGGQRRAPAGMAEVSLTFDNTDGWLPVEFSEVTITRRAYRSGENEYLINNARVRLRDVNELLAESGLTQSSHVVIGQGMVDVALSLRPQERRTLFEDAAGISVYRAQRAEAINRLDETQRNLERVHDIIGEIKPRLERLAREVERVEEQRRMEAHLNRLQSTWYGYHWGRRQVALDHALQVAAALEARLSEQQAEAARWDEQLVTLRRRESELRDQLRAWRLASADLHDRANGIQRELAVAEERARLLRDQHTELAAEIGPLTEQHAAQMEKATQAQAGLAGLERELAERREALARLESDWKIVQQRAAEATQRREAAEQELRAHRAQAERLNRALANARAEAIRQAQERAVAEERARQAQARRVEILAELERLRPQHEAQSGRVAQARAQLDQLQRDLAGSKQQIATLEREWAILRRQPSQPDARQLDVERELRERRAARQELEARLAEARAETARLAGEMDALYRLSVAGAGADEGVRALLAAQLPGVLGPLATLIHVESEWETAIERALGDDLQAVVVEHTAIVDEVRRLLERAGGWVTLLPLDSLRPPPALPADILRAADVIFCDAHLRPAVEAVAGVVALCADVEAAHALRPTLPPGSRCLTADGAVLRAEGALSLGQVRVGQARSTGLLATERARRELPAQMEAARTRCGEIEQQQRLESERIAALEARLSELERRATAARQEIIQAHRERIAQAQTAIAVAEEALRNQQASLRREDALLGRIASQIEALRRQAADLERALPLASADAHSPSPSPPHMADLTIPRLEEQHQAALEEVAACEARVQQLTQAAAAAAGEAARVERETIGPARTALAVTEEALRSQQASVERETALTERLRAQVVARQQRANELETEQTTLAARIEELRAGLAQLEVQLEEVRARIQPAEAQSARFRAEQAALEEKERGLRARLRDLEARQNRAQLEVTRCRDELKMLARRIEEDLGLVELEIAESVTAQTPLPLRPMVSPLPIVEELPDGLEEEMQRLKAHLRRMGAVNPNAPADYAEVQERHRFLSEQAADLEAASARLRQVVDELDRVMAEAFQKTFDAAAARFAELFTLLFNGGSAHLELVEPENGEGKTVLNSGVEIVARPPGKRAQRLALLSGGERSLTAVALLFAILQVSPTPFCVLDEVDAMLDEANVGRFRALLEELSRQTQFIIITHNRHTTETAHTIYGISMGADAVSQVVSLKLEEVTNQRDGETAALSSP